MTNKELGQKIRNFRKRAGISQLELEMAIEASPGSLSRIESGEVNPTKETLFEIIKALGLSTMESSQLFSVDITSEINKVIEITTSLSKGDMDILLEDIIKKISNITKAETVVLLLWNNRSKALELKKIQILSHVKTFTEKVMGLKVEKIKFYLKDNDPIINDYIKSISQEMITESDRIYNLAYPYLSKKITLILENWLNFKLSVNIPLIFNNIHLGVIGITWGDLAISSEEKELLKAYADQIAIVLHNAILFENMKVKYIRLKNKYE